MCGEEYDEDQVRTFTYMSCSPSQKTSRLRLILSAAWDHQDIACNHQSNEISTSGDDVGLQSCHPRRHSGVRVRQHNANDVCCRSRATVQTGAAKCRGRHWVLTLQVLHDLHHDTLCLYLESFDELLPLHLHLPREAAELSSSPAYYCYPPRRNYLRHFEVIHERECLPHPASSCVRCACRRNDRSGRLGLGDRCWRVRRRRLVRTQPFNELSIRSCPWTG